ncbi:MAG TPA: M20 family metallopeptidase [Acidimicrobiales bacterium]|nr:M20 family metallopeptidase [Acidimicrobiales bacterium]
MEPDAKAAAREVVGLVEGELVDLSHRIHAHPELAFEEERSSAWCAELLADRGFSVEAGVCELPTAFVATAGSGPLVLGICAEYDALPGIGHACGHNVIAAAGVGAGVALAPLADDLGITVKVFGTPAEEGGGGKILMLERGAFDGVHAAMMVHPAPTEMERLPCLAVAHVDVRYTGKEAHASAFPELGRNAADALTIAQTAIGLLRQHIAPEARIHGIVTHGGDAPNVVPAHTSGKWYIRERTLARLAELEPRVHRCFEAGALATGCEVEIVPQSPSYSEFRDDRQLLDLYLANAEELGRTFPDLGPVMDRMAGSTDMANISLAMPTIHPMLGLDSFPVSNHQPEFAEYCATPVADRAVVDGALALAWTAVDAAGRAEVRERLLTSPG